MVDELRMPVFNGNGSQDREQHMFVCEAIWTAKQVHDQNAQIMQLVTTFRDRALVWYMKFHTMTLTGAMRSLEEIKNALIVEFKKPK